jgi:hypothetical protein
MITIGATDVPVPPSDRGEAVPDDGTLYLRRASDRAERAAGGDPR